MSAMGSKGRILSLVLAGGIIALLAWNPHWFVEIFRNLLALSNVVVFVFAAAVLVWFTYAVILRRILRARRIANARMRRMMREAGNRGEDQG